MTYNDGLNLNNNELRNEKDEKELKETREGEVLSRDERQEINGIKCRTIYNDLQLLAAYEQQKKRHGYAVVDMVNGEFGSMTFVPPVFVPNIDLPSKQNQ